MAGVQGLTLFAVLGFVVLFAMVLVLSWYRQAPAIVEGCSGGTDSQASGLTAHAVNENLAALTQQLAAQSAEMRAMREAVARLQLEHRWAAPSSGGAPTATAARAGEL